MYLQTKKQTQDATKLYPGVSRQLSHVKFGYPSYLTTLTMTGNDF